MDSELQYSLDIDQLVSMCNVDQVRYTDKVDSTNSWANRSADQFDPDISVLFVTHRQTIGRGRGENVWYSGRGSLTFSLLLPSAIIDSTQLSLIPLATGLGVCKALKSNNSGLDAWIKWPNDVYVGESKLAGILVETISASSRLNIGCGINVNNDVKTMAGACSLNAISGPQNLTKVMVSVLNGIMQQLYRVNNRAEELINDLQELDGLRGRRIKWSFGANSIIGLAKGIAADGSLILGIETGEKKIYSGTIRTITAQDSRKN